MLLEEVEAKKIQKELMDAKSYKHYLATRLRWEASNNDKVFR